MSLQADSQATVDAINKAGLLGDLFLFEKIKNGNLLVGLDCTPLGAIQASCNNMAVCCEDNYQNGLLAFGCTNLFV